MRIVTVVTSLGPGGTERAAENFSMGLHAAGIDVVVIANQGGVRAENLLRAGISVFIAGPTPDDWERAIANVLDWNPDVVHVHRHCASPETTAILERLRGSVRRIVETNVFSRFDQTPTGALIDVSLQLSRWCLWKWTQRAGNCALKPVGVVLPNPVDCRWFSPPSRFERLKARQEYGIPEDALVFGRIGQPIGAKWSPAIIKSFAVTARKHLEIYLLLVGLPESFVPMIHELPSEVRNRIVLIPFLRGDENLRLCYGAMDVFLHAANIGESFGYVLCEAMLCGLPVITVSRPHKDNSQTEVVGHMRGGVIAATEHDLPAAMTLLIRDPELRRKLSKGAPEWVKTRFDIPIVTQQLLRIMQISLSSDSLEEATQRLRAEHFVTNIEWRDLRTLLTEAIGRPSLSELLMAYMVHVPLIDRCYRRMKTISELLKPRLNPS